jgi:hypothetical protein
MTFRMLDRGDRSFDDTPCWGLLRNVGTFLRTRKSSIFPIDEQRQYLFHSDEYYE